MLFLFFLLGFAAACRHSTESVAPVYSDPFQSRLSSLLVKNEDHGRRALKTIADNLRYTYLLTDYKPVWLDKKFKPLDSVNAVIAEISDLKFDGIRVSRYHLPAIVQLKSYLDTARNADVRQAVEFDTLLTHAFLVAARDLLIGTVIPKKADSLWYHVNDTDWIAPQMLAGSNREFPSLGQFRSKVPTYYLLREAYKLYAGLAADSLFNQARKGIHFMLRPDSGMHENIHWVITSELPWFKPVPNDTMNEDAQLVSTYQYYNNLKVTGKMDSATYRQLAMAPDSQMNKIAANLERLRWMQQEFGDLYVLVDVPLAELFLRKDGRNAMHMRTVVGKPERQTPSLYAHMANVVINPDWGVPPTILKNDVLPGLEKGGKKYLAKKGLKAFDREGNRVNAATINAGNYRKYQYKQDPGDDNALGYVKFNLPNPWDIYLHDTPHRDDFGKRYRALSSGCIRVQYPREMAVYILTELERRNFSMGKLDTMIDTHKTRWELLKNKIPVHIAYLTAFEDTTGEHLRFAKDIYDRDQKLISSLR